MGGDIFKTGLGELRNADCLSAMGEIPYKSIDLVLTDIPYGQVSRKSNGLRVLDKKEADIVGFEISDLMRQIVRVVRGTVYIFCGWGQLSEIQGYLSDNKFSTRVVVWRKTNPSPMNGDKIWLSGVELAVYGKLPKATFNEHCKNTVFEYPVGRNKIHPTQKNIDLFMRLIKASSNENDIVLDPFMGSGTTAVACEKLNRRWIGHEKNKEYFNAAKKRIKEDTVQAMLGI